MFWSKIRSYKIETSSYKYLLSADFVKNPSEIHLETILSGYEFAHIPLIDKHPRRDKELNQKSKLKIKDAELQGIKQLK